MACECGECTLLPKGVAPFYSPELRHRTRMGPIYIGEFTSEHWDKHEKPFLFRCVQCEQVRYSFPCYVQRNDEWLPIPHFHCNWCSPGLYVIKDADTYRELGIDDPPGGWRHFITQVAMLLMSYPPPCVRHAGSHP